MTSEFKIPLHRFDLNLLPADARQIGSEAFKMAVGMHFAAEYVASGQSAIVTVDDKEIGVMTFPRDADALDMIMPKLKAGKLAEAVPYLEAVNKDEPDNAIKQLLFCKFRFLFWGCGVSTPSQGFMFR